MTGIDNAQAILNNFQAPSLCPTCGRCPTCGHSKELVPAVSPYWPTQWVPPTTPPAPFDWRYQVTCRSTATDHTWPTESPNVCMS